MNAFQDIFVSGKWLQSFDFDLLIDIVSGGTATYRNDFHDMSVSYYRLDWSHKLFDYLSSKENSSILYKNINKVENKSNVEVLKKIKTLQWTSKKLQLTMGDYQYHFAEFSLSRIQYAKRVDKPPAHPVEPEYEEYKRMVSDFSLQLFSHIVGNEQLQKESMPGSKYYKADALSIFIKHTNKRLSLVRFKFLNQKTSYLDQGKLISVLHTFAYLFFEQEHESISIWEADFLKNVLAHGDLSQILNFIKDIDQIMIFREPKIGKIFEKYKYRFSPNYYYLHTLHTKEGVDISRGDLAEQSTLMRSQEIAARHYLCNQQDSFDTNVYYFNIVEAILSKEIYDDYIHEELYEDVLEVVNEVFFNSVMYQQKMMYHMIKNKIRSQYTEKIKSCHISYLETAKQKLKSVKADFEKKGQYRIKKSDYKLKTNCINAWIDFLEENTRLDPGNSAVFKFLNKQRDCKKYISDEFISSVPLNHWENILENAKESLESRIGSQKYKEHKGDIKQFFEYIFSNKSFLYSQRNSGRAVFFKAIEKQFNTWAEYEMKTKHKSKKIPVAKILKGSVQSEAIKLISSFIRKSKTYFVQ